MSCVCVVVDWKRVLLDLQPILDEDVAFTVLWPLEKTVGVILLEKANDIEGDKSEGLTLAESLKFALGKAEGRLQINASFPYPGHSHSFLVTSSIGLHFLPELH